MRIGMGIVAVLALTLATAWFVLQEFAYVSADHTKLRTAADRGNRAAKRALTLAGQLSFVLSGAQLGITATALLVGYIGEPLIGAGLADLLGETGWSYSVRLTVSVLLTLAFSTAVQMVIGELAPKNWAIARPHQLAIALSWSTRAYLVAAGPLIRAFDGIANALLRTIGVEPIEELPQGVTVEEFSQVVRASHREGAVDRRLSTLLQHAIGFSDLRVSQVMTPRVRVHVVRGDESVNHIIDLLATGRSRFPVIGESVDDVIGMVGIPEVLAVDDTERDRVSAAEVAYSPVTLPTTLPLQTALDRLRAAHRQLAIVIDEYGGFAGVVSFEDVAEELVGPILDEDDPDEPHAMRDGDSWLVPGHWRPDEMRDVTGWTVRHMTYDDDPGAGYATIGGLVLHELGRVAVVGDRVFLAACAGQGSDGDDIVLDVHVSAVRRHVPAQLRMAITSVTANASGPSDMLGGTS